MTCYAATHFLFSSQVRTGCVILVANNKKARHGVSPCGKDENFTYYVCSSALGTISAQILVFLRQSEMQEFDVAHMYFDLARPSTACAQVLIDALLLSRCACLVHAQSNVAVAAAYFNPRLQARDAPPSLLPLWDHKGSQAALPCNTFTQTPL